MFAVLAFAALAGLAAAAWLARDWRRPGIAARSPAAEYRDSLERTLATLTREEQVAAVFAAHRLTLETWPAGQYALTWFLDRPPGDVATVAFGMSERLRTGKRLGARFETVVFVGADRRVLGYRTRPHFSR